jgi:integrase
MNTLREAVQEYLALRRALGFKLYEAGRGLLDFVTFMEQHHAAYVTQTLALTWAQLPRAVQPAEWARRLRHVRGFARYRSATDPRTQIPPAGLLPFGLLSVSGLRLGEARNLELRDVDLNAAVLTVRGAKFGKSRLVPLHASTCQVLANYLARRERIWAARPVSSYLFVSNRGNRLDSGEIHRTFYALSRQIGLRGPADSHGPRLHDLRHRFAVQTLLGWYRAGEEVERRLPLLSTYLGHVRCADTYWYLSSWPELMQAAMRRLEQRWKERP